jgi:hypothetical protein
MLISAKSCNVPLQFVRGRKTKNQKYPDMNLKCGGRSGEAAAANFSALFY